MKGQTLYIELNSPDLSLYRDNKIQVVTSHGIDGIPFVSPTLLERVSLNEHFESENLVLAKLVEENRERARTAIDTADSLCIFSNSPGGDAHVARNISELASVMERKGASLATYAGFAGSTALGSILHASASLQCTSDSEFYWHFPTIKNHQYPDRQPSEPYRNAANVVEVQRLLRYLFMRCDSDPAVFTEINQKLLDAGIIIASDIREYMDLVFELISGETLRTNGERVIEVGALFDTKAECIFNGTELSAWHKNTTSHSTASAMGHYFSQSTGNAVAIGRIDTPWNRFFSLVEANERAKRIGISNALFLMSNGKPVYGHHGRKFSDEEDSKLERIRNEVFGSEINSEPSEDSN